jgi:hypothetical protein
VKNNLFLSKKYLHIVHLLGYGCVNKERKKFFNFTEIKAVYPIFTSTSEKVEPGAGHKVNVKSKNLYAYPPTMSM